MTEKLRANGLLFCLMFGGLLKINWIADNDSWFILNCGRYVVENGMIPHEEFASMHEGLHYVMEQWLTAVIFWKLYVAFDADGILTLTYFVGLLIIYVYYRICLLVSDENKPLSVALTLIICVFVCSPFIVTRPQIFSMLIMLIEIYLMEKSFRDGNKRRLILFPVLSMICVNLHSAVFPMLIIILFPFLAEVLISKISLRESHSKISLRTILLTIAGVFFAGFVNPYGFEAMSFIFYSYDPDIHNHITEIAPPSSQNPLGKLFFGFSTFLIVLYSRKIFPIRYFLMTFGFMLLGFLINRGVFQFLMLSTFPVAYAYKNWASKLASGTSNFTTPKMILPLFLLCVGEIYKFFTTSDLNLNFIPMIDKIFMFLMILFLAIFIFTYKRDGKIFDCKTPIICIKPIAICLTFQFIFFGIIFQAKDRSKDIEPLKPAFDFLLEQDSPKNIILWTGFNEGGYAGFRGVKYYVDARPEIFSKSNNQKEGIIKEYFDLCSGDLDYEEFFKRYNFTHIFVTENELIPFLMLSKDKNYKMIFDEELNQFGSKIHCKIFKPVDK